MFTFHNLGYYKETIIDVLVITKFVNHYLHYTICGGLDMYPRKTHWCISGTWITAFGSNIKFSVVLDLATFRIFISRYYALNLPFHTRKSNYFIPFPSIFLLFFLIDVPVTCCKGSTTQLNETARVRPSQGCSAMVLAVQWPWQNYRHVMKQNKVNSRKENV
jgi:hypothetical protein